MHAYYRSFMYFCAMDSVSVKIISKSEELPELVCNNFFHSTELFKILERTPAHTPYMALAEHRDGRVLGHILAIVRRRWALLPPYFFTQGRIYGEGEYVDEEQKEEIFGLLLRAITRKFRRKLCLFIEFSNTDKKMFGYRFFKQNDYFPIPWQEVHNSLHSMPPEERLSKKVKKRIKHIYQSGVITRAAETKAEIHQFYNLLNKYYKLKVRRFLPPEPLIDEIAHSNNGKIFITLYKDKVIGGCSCVYSEGNAYLWHLASRDKTYPHLRPNLMTVWQAVKDAYEHNYAHIFFLDAGLPFKRNRYREFILGFGGKPVAKYRWFRFSIPWVNRILSWFYRD